MHSRSPPPRKSGIDDAAALEVVRILKDGYEQGHRHKCYRSLKQAAERDGTIKKILQKNNDPEGKPFTLCTLWRRLKQVDPTLTRKTLRYTYKLTAAHRRARAAYCASLSAMPERERKRYLGRVVFQARVVFQWIDSKTLFVVFQAWFNGMHTEYHIFGYCKTLLVIFVETQTPQLIQECMHGPRGPISSLYARVAELHGPPERNLR